MCQIWKVWTRNTTQYVPRRGSAFSISIIYIYICPYLCIYTESVNTEYDTISSPAPLRAQPSSGYTLLWIDNLDLTNDRGDYWKHWQLNMDKVLNIFVSDHAAPGSGENLAIIAMLKVWMLFSKRQHSHSCPRGRLTIQGGSVLPSDTCTRVPRDDFVIFKTYNFDHAHILSLVSGFIVLLSFLSFSFNFCILDNIFEGIKPLMKNNSSSASDPPGPSQRPGDGAPGGDRQPLVC